MAYSFKQIEAHDPNNPGLVAPNAMVSIFEPGDPAMTPLTLTTLTGQALANPVKVNGLGYGPPFMHATLSQVAWSGGGLTGTFESYHGLRDEAIAARGDANAAASNAAAAAEADLETRIAAGEFKGEKGADGANVLPTDTAIKQAIDNPASETRGALNATIGLATAGKLDASAAPAVVAESGLPASGKSWFDKSRRGIFVHYVYGGAGATVRTVKRDGTNPTSLDSLANDFDVPKFANDMEAFGVDYVIFTAWHYAMYALYPSSVITTKLPGHATTSRDLLREIITALKAKGIRVVFYVHPIDGHDLTAAEQTATGWNDATNNYAVWQTFINDLITELGNRYGADLDGLWVDMVQDPAFTTRFNDKARFRRSLKAGNPSRVLIANRGVSDTAVMDNLTGLWGGIVEKSTYEYIGWPAATESTGGQNNLAAVIGGDWFAVWPQASGWSNGRNATDLFRYLVLNAGVNKFGGGTVYAAGPYPGTSAASLWEPGVESQLLGVEALAAPIRESLHDVIPSASFPTANTVKLSTLGTPGFVATRAANEQAEFIHVLNAPASGLTVSLPTPADGAEFYAGTNLRTGNPVTVTPTATGLNLTLTGGDTWHAVDTVIKLGRVFNHPEEIWLQKEFGSANGITYGSQAVSGRWGGWSFGPSTDGQIECNFDVPAHWNSFVLTLYIGQAAGTGNAILNITEASLVPGGATNVDGQGWGQSWAMNGTADNTRELTPFTPIRHRPGMLHHLRIARDADNAGDTGPTLVVHGVMVKRVS